ncbi:FHA domain-containing protein [Baekduia soli]|uniref:FHA domain-containing protein n=1 Tax=Baekduia soli TaxID=496014 RepID=A0A5B8U656_9ACTN|nr:FHA domain-containing protein [Baekduia soli]QEC48467.1 FHA domain-containing protein [Baekduia soli]
MLCPSCHCQVSRGAGQCGACGRPLGTRAPALELVLADGARVALSGGLTIGRTPANTVQLADPSVSRTHARIVAANGGFTLEDAGSSHGTWLDGRRLEGGADLRAGARIRLGDAELAVEAPSDEAAAGRTIVVPLGSSVAVSAAGAVQGVAAAVPSALRPKARAGWALKRLEAGEGERRFVLRDLEGGGFVRMSAGDAGLFELLDGSRTLRELIAEAEQREGAAGPSRLARLLADLGDRGLLEGVDSGAAPEAEPRFLARLVRPRTHAFAGAGAWFARLYRGGGWLLFTAVARVLLAAIVVAGIGVFAYLIAKRYGTPFVVARKIGLGGLVFVLGRFAVVVVHEAAHALTMASFGRRIERAGIKLILLFPYAFVDTSQAWFEPRRRRIAVSAAGPVSDFTLGGIFAVVCLLLGAGTLRDIFFQLALAAYVGAFFNLNPFLDRDGYQILVDVLREPGLRRRSKEQFQRLLSGGPRRETDSPALARYAAAGVVWSVVAVGFAVVFTLRYRPVLDAVTSTALVWTALGCLWLMLFIPVVWSLARPLWHRSERLPSEVRRVKL